MGTAARFLEEARAARVALALRAAGFGVRWDPAHPYVLMTSASKRELRRVSKRAPGVVQDWWGLGAIDIGSDQEDRQARRLT